jgi:hypothetical protein
MNYKVVDLIKYYNFNIKFVFIEHHMRKPWSFICSLSLPVIIFSPIDYLKVFTNKIDYIQNKKNYFYITNNINWIWLITLVLVKD